MLSSETRNSQRILHHEPETRRLIVSLKVCVCVCASVSGLENGWCQSHRAGHNPLLSFSSSRWSLLVIIVDTRAKSWEEGGSSEDHEWNHHPPGQQWFFLAMLRRIHGRRGHGS